MYSRCAVVAFAAMMLPGCGIGILVAGGVVGGILASKSDGPSSSSGASGAPFLLSAPSRQSLRESGSATVVAICYDLGGADPRDVEIEYARADDGSGEWWRATEAAGAPPRAPCANGRTFAWDAAADVALAGAALSVRVRVVARGGRAAGAPSDAFLVGDTPPSIDILPSSDIILVRTSDAEDDPIHDATITYLLPSGESGKIASVEELDAPRGGHRETWDWDSAEVSGHHNVHGLQVMLSGRDPFGRGVEQRASFDLLGNHPPEVRIIGSSSELDPSFEVPIPFEAFDADSHPVDVIVQFALAGDQFASLDGNSLEDPAVRRAVLLDPDHPIRAQLGIATPSSRTGGLASVIDLQSSPKGSTHAFVWDTRADADPASASSAWIRITPFDEERGIDATTVRLVEVQNDVLPNVEVLGAGSGLVTGAALGDLDGDGRADAALSLPDAASFPGDPGRSAEHGRVDVYFREADGAFSATPLSVVPGSGSSRERGPHDLLVADADGDSANDLLVLGTRCGPGDCGEEGDVSIFFGAPSGPRGNPFPATPLVLAAGVDVRAFVLADFDGSGLPDIAVSNHADSKSGSPRGVGVFIQTAPRRFEAMRVAPDCDPPGRQNCREPGLLAAADFDGDGSIDLAVRERVDDRVAIFRWSDAAGWLERSQLLDAPEAQSPRFSPVSLAAVDWNDDGRLDLAVGSRDRASFYIFLGEGGGRFALPSRICLGTSPEEVGAADMTGDGRADLIARTRPGSTGGLAITDASRSQDCCAGGIPCLLKEVECETAQENQRPPAAIALGDADGDSRPDFLSGSTDGARLYLVEGPGSLAQAAETLARANASARFLDLVLADVNGDGALDIAAAAVDAASGGSYRIFIHLRDAVGGFARAADAVLTSRPTSPKCTAQDALHLAVGSTGAQPGADIIALSRFGGVDLFFRAGASFDADPAATLEECDGLLSAGPVTFAEADEVPGLDLLVLEEAGARVRLASLQVAPNAGGKPALSAAFRGGGLPADPAPLSLAAGDFDGDALADLALHLEPGELRVLVQDAGGTWPSQRFLPAASVPSRKGVARAFPADIEGDGRLDVVLAHQSMRRIFAFCQGGASAEGALASFRDPIVLDPGGVPADAAVADWNGDGRSDIAASVLGGSSLRVFFQRPGGGFGPFSSRPVSFGGVLSGAGILAAGDVTGDSRPEIILLGPSATSLGIVRAR